MKALSLRQPWAWLVVYGGKYIENRRWHTRFRGEFLIHAAKGCTHAEYEDTINWLETRFGERGAPVVPPLADLERGGIIGSARLVDVVPPCPAYGCLCPQIDRSDRPCITCALSGPCSHPWHMPGQFGFVLEDVRPLPFRPCRGALGFFEVPE